MKKNDHLFQKELAINLEILKVELLKKRQEMEVLSKNVYEQRAQISRLRKKLAYYQAKQGAIFFLRKVLSLRRLLPRFPRKIKELLQKIIWKIRKAIYLLQWLLLRVLRKILVLLLRWHKVMKRAGSLSERSLFFIYQKLNQKIAINSVFHSDVNTKTFDSVAHIKKIMPNKETMFLTGHASQIYFQLKKELKCRVEKGN